MIPLWTLNLLLLSYTLGFPLHNTTWGLDVEPFSNDTNITLEYMLKTDLSHSDLRCSVNRIQSSPFCLLATCSLSNLGSSLQMGDERAGDLTNDPMGIGKK
ncbi:hypothetical protein IRJ41_009099 [Triplophysa rosa]|uniref:Uncharacterized protein n=1 Tax=Triplophysa rosa TaxID=992332 RepID=A0A9W7T554_TRIRA|nr:hypothetical protein IRJ41_009099 [Triplophysa rosa]